MVNSWSVNARCVTLAVITAGCTATDDGEGIKDDTFLSDM